MEIAQTDNITYIIKVINSADVNMFCYPQSFLLIFLSLLKKERLQCLQIIVFVYQSENVLLISEMTRQVENHDILASASLSTNLFAFFLLTVFADKLAAFARNNCHVRSGIFHRDNRFGLQQTTNTHSA